MHGSSFGEDQTRLAREGNEESGAIRLGVVVKDAGLRCNASHAQDVLDMLLLNLSKVIELLSNSSIILVSLHRIFLVTTLACWPL